MSSRGQDEYLDDLMATPDRLTSTTSSPVRISGSSTSVGARSNNSGGAFSYPPCPSCLKKMTVFSRKRTCTRCNITVCRACASKKSVPGEVICRMCKGGIAHPTRLDLQTVGDGLDADPYTEEEMEETHRNIVAKGYYSFLTVRVIEAKGLIAGDETLLGEKLCSDPYCVLTFSQDSTERKTSIIKRTLFPIWNEDFEIPIRAPYQTLQFEIFDRDEFTEDDSIGIAKLPLARLPPGATITGWLPVTHSEKCLQAVKTGEPKPPEPAGGIHISIRMDFKANNELGAYVRQAISPPVYVQPKFDLNEAYAPLMIIIDIIWWRSLGPCIWALLAVLFWTDVFVSAVWFVLWPFLCMYLEYWPSAISFIFAIWMCWNKLQSSFAKMAYANKKKKAALSQEPSPPPEDIAKAKQKAREPSIAKKVIQNLGIISKHKPRQLGRLTEDESIEDHSHESGSKDFEDQTLGGTITTIASVVPKWLKDIVASWQPTLRWLAQILIVITEIFRGDSPWSMMTFIILVAIGVLLLFIPYKTYLAVVGVILMIVLSPIMFLLIGVITYFTREKPTSDITVYGMKNAVDVKWLSEEAISQFDSVDLILNRAPSGPTAPVGPGSPDRQKLRSRVKTPTGTPKV